MKLTLMTLAILAVALFEIFRTIRRLQRDRMGIRSAVIWLSMWTGIGLFSLFPDLLNTVMRLGQMENRIDFLVLVAVVVLFTLVYGLTARIEQLQRDVSRAMQELALTNYRYKQLKGAESKDAEQAPGNEE